MGFIVGISGRANSGKDVIANHLIDNRIMERRVAFADYLKTFCSDIFNIPIKVFYDGKSLITKIKVTPEITELIPNIDPSIEYLTARDILQYFGTDVVRKFYPNCWVNATMNNLTVDSTVIPDVRFVNEVEAIENHGGVVIRLTRNTTNMDHISETALDDYDFKYVYDNSNETVDQTLRGITMMLKDIFEDLTTEKTEYESNTKE